MKKAPASGQTTTPRAVPDPHHPGRWSVLDGKDESDGWSYPSEAAALAAIADPHWPDQYLKPRSRLCESQTPDGA